MQDHKEQWSVKKCSSKCSKTGRNFEDQEIVTSVLKFVDGSFERFDYANIEGDIDEISSCLLYTSPSPRDATLSRMPSSA